jgi:hypothetical protein
MPFDFVVNYNIYKLYYVEELGGSCPININQIHMYMVNLYNYYSTIYNYYVTNVMPWEVRLLQAQTMLEGILNTMLNDLLTPITSSISNLKSSTTSGIVTSCLNLVKQPNTLTLQQLDLRDPTQVAGFLNSIATTLSTSYASLYNAVDCINFYLPSLERAVEAYLNALASRFRRISGGMDIVAWAQQHGIACSYTASSSPVVVLNNVIDTYYNLLNPSSTISFVNSLNITTPAGILSPTALSEGGLCR